MNYVGYQYYEIGITIEDAKIKFPEYFRKTWTDNYKKSEYDTRYMTKNKAIDVIIYSKNGKLVGFERNRLNLGTVQSHVDDFNAKFQFSPSEEKYYQFKIYTWKKNEKKIEIWFDTITNEIELRQWDGLILIQ